MSFSFQNSPQAEELIKQLQLGQIIQVQVIEKKSNSQYLITYKGLQLTAVSEVDLLSKSVWLKLTQKTPFPKLQIIIEENKGALKNLFEFAEDKNLIIPFIPIQIKTFLTTTEEVVHSQELFDFLKWYTDKIIWGIFDEYNYTYLLANGISFGNILTAFNDYMFPGTVTDTHHARILKSPFDLVGIDKNIQDLILYPLEIIEKINALLTNIGLNLALLYIKHPLQTVILPLECTLTEKGNIMKGAIKTKHFGNIYFKYDTHGVKPKIDLLFENNLYINSLKDILAECVKNTEITLNLSLQLPNNPQNQYKGFIA